MFETTAFLVGINNGWDRNERVTLAELSLCMLLGSWLFSWRMRSPNKYERTEVSMFLKVPVLYLSGQDHGKEGVKAKLKISNSRLESAWGGGRCLETKATLFLAKTFVFGSPSPALPPVEGWRPHIVRGPHSVYLRIGIVRAACLSLCSLPLNLFLSWDFMKE